MEHFVRSLKVFWRSERLLKENELRLATQKIALNALTGLVALFGFVMLSLSVFFALVPYMGQALAALTVCGVDFLLAGILAAYARTLKPAPEIEMVKEMRNMSLASMEEEIALAEREFVNLKKEVQRIIRNPMDTLLPMAAAPLLAAALRGLSGMKKKTTGDKDAADD